MTLFPAELRRSARRCASIRTRASGAPIRTRASGAPMHTRASGAPMHTVEVCS